MHVRLHGFLTVLMCVRARVCVWGGGVVYVYMRACMRVRAWVFGWVGGWVLASAASHSRPRTGLSVSTDSKWEHLGSWRI